MTRTTPSARGRRAGSAFWAAIALAALAIIVVAVLVTPPSHRLLVLGLALVACPLALALDLLGARTAHRVHAASLAPAPTRSDTVTRPPADHVGSASEPVVADAALDVAVFTWPKDGNAESENEDGHAQDAGAGWAAVSDGASSSVCAREWAEALTAGFVTRRPMFSGDGVRDFLRETALGFDPGDAGPAGPWWGADALRGGAFATLLGFHVRRAPGLVHWEAVAIGDSVVVQLRSESSGPRLVEGFPLESSLGFGGAPSLVGSVPAQLGQFPAVRIASGIGETTDRWLLLTDEAAKWAFHCDERGEPIWSLLLDGNRAELTAAITAARRSGAMANDDLTVARLALR